MEIILLIPKPDKPKAEELLKVEPFDRQSQDWKEPEALGFDDKGLYLRFAGNDAVVKELEAKLKGVAKRPKKEADILKAIKAEENSVSAGIGLFDI